MTLARRGSTIPQSAKDRFVERLREGGTVAEACRAANIGRGTAYRLREQDEAFDRAWQDAYEDGTDVLEGVAWQLATEQGRERMIEMLLRARRPSRYGQRVEVNARVAAVSAGELERLRLAGQRDPEAFERAAAALIEDGDDA